MHAGSVLYYRYLNVLYVQTAATAGTNCATGFFSGGGASQCTLCPSYTRSRSTFDGCDPCAAGYNCTVDPRQSIALCPSGYWSPLGYQGSCISCPAGTYCSDPRVPPRACPAGQYSLGNAGACTDCPAGYQCPSADQGPSRCPVGTYAPGTEASYPASLAPSMCYSLNVQLIPLHARLADPGSIALLVPQHSLLAPPALTRLALHPIVPAA
jgi:hypothetical protein